MADSKQAKGKSGRKDFEFEIVRNLNYRVLTTY